MSWKFLVLFFLLGSAIAYPARAIAQTPQPLTSPDYWFGPWFMWGGGWSFWWICPLMMVFMMIVMMFACRFMCSWHDQRDHW